MPATSTATVASPAVPVPARVKAILSPNLDLLIIAGISLVGLTVMLLWDTPAVERFAVTEILWLSLLINSPHFVASGFLLYGSRETRENHRWAAYWLPAGLAVYVAFAFYVGNRTTTPTYLLLGVTALYLSWHYIAQTWGMVATFLHLDGIRPTDGERKILWASLYIMMVWHIVWALHYAIDLPPVFDSVIRGAYGIMRFLGPVALVAGLVGFGRMRVRIGRSLPIRAVLPWVTLCVWYAFLARYPLGGLFWVQLSHSMQYLIFPPRIEANRWTERKQRADAGEAPAPRFSLRTHMVLYVGCVLGLGVLIFGGVPWLGEQLARGPLDGSYPPGLLGVLVCTAINFLHFFTDGVVWKLRNPFVRRQLFAHLPRPAA